VGSRGEGKSGEAAAAAKTERQKELACFVFLGAELVEPASTGRRDNALRRRRKGGVHVWGQWNVRV